MTKGVTGMQRLSADDKNCHWQAELIYFILIGFLKHSDTISMELPISKGSQLDISIKLCISVPEDCFYLSKLCRP